MSRRAGHGCALAAVALIATLWVGGCAVGSDGTVYGPAVGFGVDYDEPLWLDGGYGQWGPGYDIGPFRDGHPGGGRPGGGGRGFRPSGPSRGIPSIPTGQRGGGGHGGGGHVGGGGHGGRGR